MFCVQTETKHHCAEGTENWSRISGTRLVQVARGPRRGEGTGGAHATPRQSCLLRKNPVAWNGLWSRGLKRSVQTCVIQAASVCPGNTKSFSDRVLFHPFLNLKGGTSVPNALSSPRCLLATERLCLWILKALLKRFLASESPGGPRTGPGYGVKKWRSSWAEREAWRWGRLQRPPSGSDTGSKAKPWLSELCYLLFWG